MIVAGIDPSLTATGIAIIDLDQPDELRTETIASKGHRDAPVVTRLARLRYLADSIAIATQQAGLAVIEYPTLSQGRQGGHLDRHGLWWMIIDRLHFNRTPIAVVTASGRAKYATGKGNASKDEVLLAVAKRYLNADVKTNDEADALILAAMGARYLGHPIEEHLPQTHLAAMAGAEWPTR